MDKRMFEHSDEGKFWEIWGEGPKIFTRHGKLGASGQTKVKDGDAATVDKMIKEKVGGGYTQTGGEVAKGPELDKKELKRHLGGLKPLVDDPAYLVLADWLQTQDHPWGELIVLQHGAATNPKKAASLAKQAAKHLKENGPAILGELANKKHSHFDWHHGFVRRAVIGTPAYQGEITKAVKALLAQPVAHMVETVVMSPYRESFTTYRDWGASDRNLVDPWTDLEKLAKAIPDRITRIGFGGWPAPAAAAYVQMPSFTKLSAAFPQLTALELTGWCGDKPGKLSLPALTDLAIRFARGTGDALKALASSKLPKLQRLTVWLGGSSNVIVDDVYSPDDYDEEDEGGLRYPATYSGEDLAMMDASNSGIDCDVSADDLGTLLAANFGPALTHLEIGAPRWTADLITAIARSPLVKRIKTLTLSGGSLDDEHLEPLVAAKKALAHLESIELALRIDAAGVKKVSALAKVRAIDPGRETEDFHFRYVATME